MAAVKRRPRSILGCCRCCGQHMLMRLAGVCRRRYDVVFNRCTCVNAYDLDHFEPVRVTW